MRVRHLCVLAAVCCAGSGRADPFATRFDVRPGESLSAVRDRIRALSPVARSNGVDVVFSPGEYRLDETLLLDERDGGVSADRPVVWRAKGSGDASLSMSRRIPVSRFARVTDPTVLGRLPPENRGNTYVADVGDLLPKGSSSKMEVFLNDDFGTCARWPNAGEWTSFTGRVDIGTMTSTYKRYERGAFVYENARAKRWDFKRGVKLFGYWTHDWASENAVSHFYGAENGTNDVLRLSSTIWYGINAGSWGRKERRFYVWDLLEELDAPGEWWFDADEKKLYLVPFGDSLKPDDRICLAAESPALLEAKGLRNFTLEGFAFRSHNGNAVVAERVADVTVRDCLFEGVCGDAAIRLDGVRCRVVGCTMRHLGASGIRLDGGDRKKLVRSGNLVEGCRILDFSVRRRTYNGAMEVEGCGHVIRGNEFAYAPHHAMRYETNETLIENNDIHHVLLETGDAGAIYTGRDCTTQGNVLRHNFIHELGETVEGVGDDTMALYFDDFDCGDAVIGNVFWRCSRGIMVGGGRDHPIVGNVFAECKTGLSIDHRGHDWGFFFTRKKGHETSYQPERMEKMDVTSKPWKSRYPRLAGIMQDSPEDPLYDPVVSNVFVDCSKDLLWLPKKGMDAVLPKMTVADNLVLVTKGTARWAEPDGRVAKGFSVETNVVETGFSGPKKGDFRLVPGSSLRKKLPTLDLGPRFAPQ